MNEGRGGVFTVMRIRVRSKTLVFAYASVISAIVFSFAWQMLHGICPVP